MQQPTWDNPNKMHVATGHKTFDRQCEYLDYGNVWATCQFSNFIRPYTETECNGRQWQFGQLQNGDLAQYTGLPRFVRERVERLAKYRSVILYEFRHWQGHIHVHDRTRYNKTVDGYLVTEGGTNKLLYQWAMTPKAWRILEWCAPYVSEPNDAASGGEGANEP